MTEGLWFQAGPAFCVDDPEWMHALRRVNEVNGGIGVKQTVERWGTFEIAVRGVDAGNPFTERTVSATFTGAHESVTVDGFYDGEGVYRVRFMPSFEGEYTYAVDGNYGGGRRTGRFCAVPATGNNHGPVRVANRYHFAYADGTPYYCLGTTCYVWDMQSDARIAETLRSLKDSAFNKIRFCVFPKHYDYNLGEPRSYPYAGTPMDSGALTRENFQQYTFRTEGNRFDYTRFNPAHFRHVEWCIEQLQALGIEADIIMMHPYDRWGFCTMTKEQDDLYWRYAVARFAAYRNVWWSLANEYDLFPTKTVADWERFAGILVDRDPYGHLRSIHNCRPFYDYTRPWVTHCSIQRQDLYKSAELVDEWRERFGKPVVLDEIAYEGNIQHGWGNISGEELTRRFWEAACRGGYPGHGETYMNPDNVLWWSHGGKLRGESWKRFALLRQVLSQVPGLGLMPWDGRGWDEVCGVPECEFMQPVKSCYLFYYSFMRPAFREYHFDDDTEFEVRVIDTWEMTVEDRGTFRGRFRVDLPGKSYMAVQITRHG